ncbi:unnamed protein product [Effrenium voratum]|nr:unnamed protein product [Effrenium voratum]
MQETRPAAMKSSPELTQLLMEKSVEPRLPVWLFVVQQFLAASVAVVITILDNFPYGFLLFPMAKELQGMGISMVLLSAALAQAVFSVSSDLPAGLGCMIVENIPMLHSMAKTVTISLANSPEMIISTVLALYSTASLLTAIAFFLLGYFNLERVFKILPRPVLMGCIAGMGLFILTAGVGACTGIAWEWDEGHLLQQAGCWPKIACLCCLEGLLLMFLKLCKGKDVEPFVLPLFFFGLVLCSWLALVLLKIPHRNAQAAGWFFEDTPAAGSLPLQLCSWRLIAWHVFPSQLPLLCGIVVFSCLHVPVNVPALAQATGRRVDVNKELTAHGMANLVAAGLASLQTYMVYSSSLLYFRCGGGSRVTGFCIALAVMACIPLTSSLICYLPRMLAGVLLGHLGVELLWESVVDTWPRLGWPDYLIVVFIAGVCNVSFIYGLMVGLLCACVAFVVEAAMSDPVRFAFYPGRGLRSRKIRSQRQLQLLADFDQKGGFLVLRLHGTLFFGNTHSLQKRVQQVSCLAVILDFAQVISMDSSAFSEVDSLAGAVQSRGITVICSGLGADAAKVKGHVHLMAAHSFPDMEHAVEAVEEMALASPMIRTAVSMPALGSRGGRQAAVAPQAAADFFVDVCVRLLEPLGFQEETAIALRDYFEFQQAPLGAVLWAPGDPSDFAFLLVSGHVGVLDDRCDRFGRTVTRFIECSLPGQFTGELNLFTGEPRKNKIEATEDLTFWTITQSSLSSMQQDALPLAFALQSIALRYAAHRMYLSMLDGHVHTV